MNIANLEVLGNGGLIIYCIYIKIVSWGVRGELHTSMSLNAGGPCVLLSLALPLFPQSSLTEPEAQHLGQAN